MAIREDWTSLRDWACPSQRLGPDWRRLVQVRVPELGPDQIQVARVGPSQPVLAPAQIDLEQPMELLLLEHRSANEQTQDA